MNTESPLTGPTTRRTVLAGAAAVGLSAAMAGTASASASGRAGASPTRELFGRLPDGTKVHRWTLENGGTRLRVLSYGGIVQSLEIPDRRGRYANVSLGFDNLDDYLTATTFFGALIGRYGNRIAAWPLHPRRPHLPTPAQRRAEQPARRHEGLRHPSLGRRAVQRRHRRRPRAVPGQPGRRDGLPRHPAGEGDLHPDPARHLAHRLRGHHRPAHRRQPHQPHLLQPRGRGKRRCVRS